MLSENRTSSRPMLGVIGVIRRDDRLLIIQRSMHVRVPLAWCFPGGEIEAGETQAEALVREMREELDAEVRPDELLTTQTKHGGSLILYCWSATLLTESLRPNPQEVAQVEWLTPVEIRDKPGILPGTMEILAHIGP